MSRRLTKEELDLQFEQFLKESVSDDSVESGSKRPSVLDSLGKPPLPRAERQKTPPARPWWQDDDDEFEKPVKRMFLKARKPSVEESQSRGNPAEVTKPVPKPRTRAIIQRPGPSVVSPSPPLESYQAVINRPEAPVPIPSGSHSSSQTASPIAMHYTSQSASVVESQEPSGHRSHTASAVSSPVSSESSSHNAPRRREHQASNDTSDRMPGSTSSSLRHATSHDASGFVAPITDIAHDTPVESGSNESNHGLLGSGRTFRKSLRKSQPIQEEDEEKPQRQASGDDEEQGEGERSAIGLFSRDSLEPDESVMASGPVDVVSRSGLDTLEEEEEEERRRFFARLESGANSTIDYSRLNRELESTGSTLNTLLRRTDVSEALQEEKSKVCEKISTDGSGEYSEDFDEEEASDNEKEPLRPDKPGMLAKVSLHDSLNSTDGVLVPAEAAAASSGEEEEEEEVEVAVGRKEEEAPAGQSYGQSGASEVEALQEAYRQLSRSAEESEVREQGSYLTAGGVASQTLSPGIPLTSTLKPVSTTESDLPTAEELMRPIGPDSSFARGFSLHPVSEVDQQQQEQEVVRDSRERSPARGRPQDDDEDERPASATSHHRSIAEEVRRLMEEQEEEEQREVKTPQQQRPGNQAKGRKRQLAWRPTIFAHTSASARRSVPLAKPSPAHPVAKTSGTVHTGQTAKLASPQVQRKHQNQEQTPSRIPTLGRTQTIKDSEASLHLSSELVASVQSFAAFLQQQVEASSSSPRKNINMETADTQALPKPPEEAVGGGGGEDRGGAEGSGITPVVPSAAERSSLERLRLQLAQKDREVHLREQELHEEHSRQISSLKQENYLLHSKLRQAEEESQQGALSPGHAGDQLSDRKLRHLEKEVREQETLLQGYHQENEKLYLQVKALQAQNKHNEEAMFTENQRLHHELAIARDKLSRNTMPRAVGVVGTGEEDFNVSELLAQVKALERSEARLQEEARRLRQEKQALQVDLDIMKKERDLAKIQTLHTSGDLGFELKVLEQRHQEEVAALKKRLQWYAENQELLDRDSGRLRAATAEVKVLTEQVERLKSQVDSKACQQQRRIRERAADAKRIQDLERQVKEMEDILRRRHPNSLPALMYAAAAAEAAATAIRAEEVQEKPEKPERSPTPTTPKSTILLQRRVQRLEAELESRDEDAKRSLRAIEQQFHRIKLQYEQRIGELQQQLSLRKPEGGGDGEENEDIQSLQEEVQRLKEARQERESAQEAEVASLREQLSKAQQPHQRSPGASTQRHQRQAEEAQAGRIERLMSELAAKTRGLQELSRTVERLQRERHAMLSGRWAGVKGHESKGKTGVGSAAAPAVTTKATMTTESFPATQDEKAYQPAAFAGSHISEVQAESDRLQESLERLEQERQQEREALQQAATHAQAELQRLKEHSTQQLAALSADHQRELESLRARHALEHSSSKVAELTNQVSSQEIMVCHLRDQLKELQGTKEALTVSKLREDTLQHQLTRLLDELKQAKEAHSPELRHFTSLERKIHNMELRYTEREKELQQVIAETRVATQAELQGELERWKRLAQSRSRELDTFRLELDAILDVLRELQRQGVVIPASEHTRIPWGR